MSLKLVSLASGSKGNATLVFSDRTALLIDAGISYTQINTSLREFGLCVSGLDGILITHEHADHIAGLARSSKDCRIYAHHLTKSAILKKIGAQMEISSFEDIPDFMDGFLIGDIFVKPFETSHDAAFPVAYTFECGGSRVSILTDTGTVSRSMFENICRSQAVLIEANHDRDMLINGPYVYPLKRRILSDLGHMSNAMCAKVVSRLVENGITKQILIGHLSEINNRPEIAYKEVNSVVMNSEAEVFLTYQNKRSEVCVAE